MEEAKQDERGQKEKQDPDGWPDVSGKGHEVGVEDDRSDESGDAQQSTLSVVLALACELAEGHDRDFIVNLWQGSVGFDPSDAKIAGLLARLDLQAKVLALLDEYKARAIASLEDIDNALLFWQRRKWEFNRI